MTALPLGMGVATLMREPSARQRRRLLDHAYELGYRHFDVAPVYGLGAGETELGKFVAGHSDVVVTTKVGLAPGRGARLVSHVQGPLRAALRTFPALRAVAKNRSSAAATSVEVTADAMMSSVQQSLERLRVDAIDRLLLHEVPATDLSEAALRAAENLVERGAVRRFGVSGPPEVIRASDVDNHDLVTVVQTSDSLAPSTYFSRRDVAWVHYGVLSMNLHRLAPVLDDRPRQESLEQLLDRPLRSLEHLAGALVLLSAAARPGATVLVGTTSEAHLATAAQAVEGALPEAEAVARARRILTDGR
ncbi:aldo/keto reductase [Blastococcus sp. TF02A-30]|uniref:aldo/keto reductase n=1 Tax=Blastococcus sp. TF02A-30 TaxID=2250580 RepID=UPI000DEBF1FB|nr:aldo/keto reductase [Blastococcus sp. TF02A-30]RBY84507.1 hypothetical protein DQ241_17660 [Blastococcus sp. TF02A-30]